MFWHLLSLAAPLASVAVPAAAADRCVILLHGLARTETSIVLMQAALEEQGYQVVRPGYPSTEAPVEELVKQTLPAAVAQCGPGKIDFVTHSMGGILLRQWVVDQGNERIGRAVMLAPPNQGSELVDELGDVPGFDWINGPAGVQMGTKEGSLPRSLPAVTFDLGIIAGSQSLNPLYSSMLPGPDDGKVSVAATKVEGMADHIVFPVTHTFMMNNPRVIGETIEFLRNGKFDRSMTWMDGVLDSVGCEDLECITGSDTADD